MKQLLKARKILWHGVFSIAVVLGILLLVLTFIFGLSVFAQNENNFFDSFDAKEEYRAIAESVDILSLLQNRGIRSLTVSMRFFTTR